MTRSRSHIRSRLGGSCSGRQYCYRAQDTAVEVVPGLRPDWIEIGGKPAGTAARIRIGRRNLNRRIWYALVPVTSPHLGSAAQRAHGHADLACELRKQP